MGLAVANASAQLIGVLWLGWILFTSRSRLHLTPRGYRLDKETLWRIPPRRSGFSYDNGPRAGPAPSGGFRGSFRRHSFGSLRSQQPCPDNLGIIGLGQASGVMVGQNLAAQKASRAKQVVAWALLYSVLVNSVIAGLIVAFPKSVLSIFSRDADLLSVAVPWLHIQAIGFFVMGANMVMMQSFNTAGDTVIPMIVTLTSNWFIQQPLAVMLSGVAQHWSIFGLPVPIPTVLNLGQYGIAWAIVASMGVRLLFYFPCYIWGPWTKKQVLADAGRRKVGVLP
jgi:Na+-driven multidrug efflux pump